MLLLSSTLTRRTFTNTLNFNCNSVCFKDVTLPKNQGSLGFSIIGGTDHSCVPFGAHEPGVFISHVSWANAVKIVPRPWPICLGFSLRLFRTELQRSLEKSEWETESCKWTEPMSARPPIKKPWWSFCDPATTSRWQFSMTPCPLDSRSVHVSKSRTGVFLTLERSVVVLRGDVAPFSVLLISQLLLSFCIRRSFSNGHTRGVLVKVKGYKDDETRPATTTT